jgi:hypothetical protein
MVQLQVAMINRLNQANKAFALFLVWGRGNPPSPAFFLTKEIKELIKDIKLTAIF